MVVITLRSNCPPTTLSLQSDCAVLIKYQSPPEPPPFYSMFHNCSWTKSMTPDGHRNGIQTLLATLRNRIIDAVEPSMAVQPFSKQIIWTLYKYDIPLQVFHGRRDSFQISRIAWKQLTKSPDANRRGKLDVWGLQSERCWERRKEDPKVRRVGGDDAQYRPSKNLSARTSTSTRRWAIVTDYSQ